MPVTASSELPEKHLRRSGGSPASCQEEEVTALYGRSILLLSHGLNARITFF
jgi:hypothetical protein